MSLATLQHQILKRFPKVEFAFGYGSKVMPQAHDNAQHSMIDLIFVVANSRSWHAQNLEANPSDYSACFRALGPDIITKFQRHPTLGAQVYYNPFVSIQHDVPLVKYGVIEISDLIQDLENWTSLYLSGRMHKPIFPLTQEVPATLERAMQHNHEAALNVSLLLCSSLDDSSQSSSIDTTIRIHEHELYNILTGLSYLGDFRMQVPGGENPHKVRNIVQGQMQDLSRMYAPMFDRSCAIRTYDPETRVLEIDVSRETRAKLYRDAKHFPSTVAQTLGLGQEDNQHILENLVQDHHSNVALREALGSIVRRSSQIQSLKGICTAGLVKSITYVQRKLSKTYLG